jgi:hypothetical protein
MKLTGRAQVLDWANAPLMETPGASGVATARSLHSGDVQIRLVSYSRDYVADHWCSKGHIVFVVEGALTIEYQDGGRHDLEAGNSYLVGDNERSPHKVVSPTGASIFIVD